MNQYIASALLQTLSVVTMARVGPSAYAQVLIQTMPEQQVQGAYLPGPSGSPSSAALPFGQYCDNQPLARPVLSSDGGLTYQLRAAAQCPTAIHQWLDHAIYAYDPASPDGTELVAYHMVERLTSPGGELLTPPSRVELTSHRWYELHSTASWTFPDGTWKMSYEIQTVRDIAALQLTSPADTNLDGILILCVDDDAPVCDATIAEVVIPVSAEIILGEPVDSPKDVVINSLTAQLTLGGEDLACSGIVNIKLTDNDYQIIQDDDGLYRRVIIPASGTIPINFGPSCAISSNGVRLNLSVNFTLSGTTLSGLSDYIDHIWLHAADPVSSSNSDKISP